MLIGDLLDNLILEQWRTIGTKRRVSSQDDSLCSAVVDEFLLNTSPMKQKIVASEYATILFIDEYVRV